MKKFIFMSLLTLMCVALTGCSSCHSDKAKQETENEAKVLTLKLTPEHCISNDREGIWIDTKKDPKKADAQIVWSQTGITLTSFITDAEIQDATVMEVTNGFQRMWDISDKGCMTDVYIISTNTMVTDTLTLPGSFYFDNQPLNDKEIRLTFADAVERILETNGIKPQTRILTLRSPFGPIKVDDAFYIAKGLNGVTMFVNARTGEVTNYNPAFVEKEVEPNK